MNNFYSDFDFSRIKESKRSEDYRTPFQIDRDRIIHSSEFRRLQGKTQVFLPFEYDFYRTRLTHSIEVAQIGRSICNYINKKFDNYFNENFYIDSDLVEAACLAHDLGHPPFGHAGERTLNKLMKDNGGFEGNAQTLRSIAETFYRDENKHRGMNPTRAVIDSVLKYKLLYSDLFNPENHFLYDDQKIYVDYVFENSNYKNEFSEHKQLNKFRSIECQIMDWADDTAYAVNDIVDAIKGNFVTIAKLNSWFVKSRNLLDEDEEKYILDLIDWIKNDSFRAKFGSMIGEFINAIDIIEQNNFISNKTNRYKYSVIINEKTKKKSELFKKIAMELIFKSAQIHQLEHKRDFMLKSIFNVLIENYIIEKNPKKLLFEFTDNLLKNEESSRKRIRLICDYIAGMTDTFTLRTYKRLFDPEYVSLIDIA